MTLIVFIAIHLIPGSFVDLFVSVDTGADVKARLTHTYGLDEPLPLQYVRWLQSMLSGDLGVSLRSRVPVAQELGERLPATAELAGLAMLLSLVVGVPLGIAAGLAARAPIRLAARFIGATGLSVPNFVLGSFLVYVFSSNRFGLVVGNYVAFTASPVDNLRAMVLPAITLSVFTIAMVMRTMSDAVVGVMPELHIGAAIARGESPPQVVRRHVLRNAAIPVLTVAAAAGGYLLGGAVIVETIFSIPGIGSYAVTAVTVRDYPVVLACVTISAVTFITLNTLADLVYPLIDPRIGARRQGR